MRGEGEAQASQDGTARVMTCMGMAFLTMPTLWSSTTSRLPLSIYQCPCEVRTQ